MPFFFPFLSLAPEAADGAGAPPDSAEGSIGATAVWVGMASSTVPEASAPTKVGGDIAGGRGIGVCLTKMMCEMTRYFCTWSGRGRWDQQNKLMSERWEERALLRDRAPSAFRRFHVFPRASRCVREHARETFLNLDKRPVRRHATVVRASEASACKPRYTDCRERNLAN